MNLTEWKSKGKYFDYKGFPIFYQQSDQNEEVLLCLHGFPCASFDYHKIWDKLSEKYSCLAYDMIGYGFSAKPNNFDYTTFQQVDILQAFLAELKIKKIHILAHDYGNTITQELLARDSENRLNIEIKSICLLNGALFPETHRPILAQKILISPFGFLFGNLISDSRFKQGLSSVFGAKTQPTKQEFANYITLFKHNNGKKIAYKLIRYMTERAKFRERWVKPLGEINIPLRFINGLADRVSGEHLVKRFREVYPNHIDIIELAEIGHFPHLEVPKIVLEKYFEFRILAETYPRK
jgi:pimeloyl-ACP methyl ester carboxylesterase